MRTHHSVHAALFVLIGLPALAAGGEDHPSTRVLAPGDLPRDARLEPLKDLSGYFPFSPPASLASWEQRAAEVRRRILVAMGLWPMPERPTIQATVHGLVDRDDYTVEKVYFESYPGFYVTGSLYRPRGKTGPFPVVLSPHGHFADGRFHGYSRSEVRRRIVKGAERFEIGGRHPLQARCVQLARMGCVVFHYDMVGYADSRQISYQVAHRHAEARPHLEQPDRWGLYTTQAELRLQSVMGLQTLNSLRAVDFVLTLPDVDAARVAVTGASGGGTQTMILAGIDPRIAVSFPAVMVSTAMQGGCTCENACCLRVGTGNIEFAALFAPKPQGLTAADDWTVELAAKGLPELRQLYALYGAEQRIAGYPLTHFEHNYNHVSRGKMYQWMNRHLDLGWDEPVLEADYQPLSRAELSVWDDHHPLPQRGEAFETRLLRELAEDSDQQLNELRQRNDNMAEFRQIVAGALETILACDWADVGPVAREKVAKEDRGDYWLFRDVLREPSRHTELPTVFLHPKQWNGDVVLWVSGRGKAGLMNEAGQPRPEVQRLLSAGRSVASADLLRQGEFLENGDPIEQTRKVANERDFAGYTFGYNPTLLAQRAWDVLTLLKFVVEDEHRPRSVHLVGVEGATPTAVLAAVLAGERIAKLAIDDGDFRFVNLRSWRDPDFLPGAVKYGDLPCFIGLCRADVWVASRQGNVPRLTRQVHATVPASLTVDDATGINDTAISWLCDRSSDR